MSDGIYSALSGAVAQQRSLDVVANNVANANTTGFRADRVAFRESVVAAQNRGTAPEPMRYVEISQIATDDSQGAMKATGNPLDLAIQGDGWFELQTPNGVRYTRAGSFVTNGDGVLMTQDGHRVRPAGGGGPDAQIVIPDGTSDVRVARNGEVSADGAVIGRVRLARFEEGQLQKEGLTLYTADAPPQDAEEAEVLQGHLEGSNMNAVAGLNELITASRSFEAFQRVIQGFRDIDERTARDLGK